MNGKPFTDVLGEIENGQLLRELTEAVYNITLAVRETRKPGGLKLALKFTPTGRGSVEIDAKYDSLEPELDRADLIEDTAFGELTKRISEATGIGAYMGRE